MRSAPSMMPSHSTRGRSALREGAGTARARPGTAACPSTAARTAAAVGATRRRRRRRPGSGASGGGPPAGPSGSPHVARRPDRGQQLRDLGDGRRGDRHRNEQAHEPAAGRSRRPGPSGVRVPASTACAPRPALAVGRRTSSAASRSRQPTTSVSLCSRSLYVWKKCSISTSRCGPDLLEPLDVRLVRVPQRDAQDLEVEALLVAHLQAADRARPDMAAGERGLVDDQQRVGVVPVAGPRALDEAVVEVVEDRRRQDAIEPEHAGDCSSNSYLLRDPRGISTTTSIVSGNGGRSLTREP